MPSIVQPMPTSMIVRDGSSIGLQYPAQISAFRSSPSRYRRFADLPQRTYSLQLGDMSPAALAEFEAWVRNSRHDLPTIVEPHVEIHRDLVCGPLADGSRTTYPIPVIDPSDVVVFVDGVPQSSGFTLHQCANLVSEAGAMPTDAADFAASGGSATGALVSAPAAVGSASYRGVPDGAAAMLLSQTVANRATGVVAGDTYTEVIAAMETRSTSREFKTRIQWYSGASYISGDTSAGQSIVAGGWVLMTYSATAPATTDGATTDLIDNTAGGLTDPVYVGAFALCPGDYDRWHLPSQAPALVEFDTAPAAGARVTATATGRRLARCRIEDRIDWQPNEIGGAKPSTIVAVEALEY